MRGSALRSCPCIPFPNRISLNSPLLFYPEHRHVFSCPLVIVLLQPGYAIQIVGLLRANHIVSGISSKDLMRTRIEPLLANAFIVGIFSALVIEHIFFRGQAEKKERHEEPNFATIE